MTTNTVPHERIATLERELEAEKARAELEAKIEEDRSARDPLKIATDELMADIEFQVERERVADDITMFSIDLERLRFKTLRGVEALESRRQALADRGGSLDDSMARHFRARDINLAFSAGLSIAPEGARALNLEPPVVRVHPDIRCDLEVRSMPTLLATGLTLDEIALLHAGR